jgi:hypothetical protein
VPDLSIVILWNAEWAWRPQADKVVCGGLFSYIDLEQQVRGIIGFV